jgi:hypothetical protein
MAPDWKVRRLAAGAAWTLFLYLIWFDVLRDDLGASLGPELPARALTAAAFAALASRVAWQVIETGFYVTFWKLRAVRLSFGGMFTAVLSLSMLDALASALSRAAGSEGSHPWLAPLVGVRALAPAPGGGSGLGLAFGSLGLLALARVIGTAWAQRREGAPWPGALAVTLGAWSAGRLALWWSTDLLRGMSPLP